MCKFRLYHCRNDYKYAPASYNCILCDYCSAVYCDCQNKIYSLVCYAPSDTVTNYNQNCPYFKEHETPYILKCCAPPDCRTNCPLNKSPV